MAIDYQHYELQAPLLPVKEEGLPEFVPPPSEAEPEPAPITDSARGGLITLRHAVPDDRQNLSEICAGTWQEDPVPQAFEHWLQDDTTIVHVAEAETDRRPVAVHHLDVGGRVAWYEGLRVAPTHRRRGIATSMLDTAVTLAQRRRCEAVRLTAAADGGRRLVERRGFTPQMALVRWEAAGLRGKPKIYGLNPEDAEVAYEWLMADPGFQFHSGLNPTFGGARQADIRLLRDLATSGLLRTAPDGSAMAGLVDGSEGEPLRVSFLAGSGEALAHVLGTLRMEAAADGRGGVRILLPPDHPSSRDVSAAGFERADLGMMVYSLQLN